MLIYNSLALLYVFFPARLNYFFRFRKVSFNLVAFLSRMFEVDLGLVHFFV